MKRKRGLSGTPDQHAFIAAQFAKNFRVSARSVRRFLDAGDCAMALHSFRQASADAAGYATNRVTAGRRSPRTALTVSRHMQDKLTTLEDKLLWCTWKKYRRKR